MPLKLTVRSGENQVEPFEFPSDHAVVTIGRQAQDATDEEAHHLHLPDEQRMLSRVHARIERRDGAYKITDLSENGTWLENQPLKRGKWYKLINNSEIRIGTYVLTFTEHELAEEATKPVHRTDLRQIAERVYASLHSVYQTYAQYDQSALQELFRSELSREVRQLTGYDALELLVLLRAQIKNNKPVWADLMLQDGWYDTELIDPVCQKEAFESAYETLTGLKYYFFASPPSFRSRDVADFGEQLRISFEILVKGVVQLLKGRRQFTDDLDAGVTKWLGSDPNPVKAQKTAKELARYVLDWQDGEKAKQARANLEHAIQDLEIHQLASLTAFRDVMKEGFEQLIARMDPEVINRQAKDELPAVFNLFLPVVCWRVFQQTYAKEKDIGLHSWLKEVEDIFVEKYHEFHRQSH
ncbi:MAG: type VI secretion system-associated FHA domain protein [bacterium]